MSEFQKYQHVERLGTDETDGILEGVCYIFPKIDGTNGSIWWDGGLQFGSRNRHLEPGKDNQGFMGSMMFDVRLQELFEQEPNWRLYGEWLVPHSLKTYRDEAWRKFYIFDVMAPLQDGSWRYVHPSVYVPVLTWCDLNYIPPLAVIENPSEEQVRAWADKNTFLMKDGHIGEGIVVKNYLYRNRWGRQTWAKVVRNEFRDKHLHEMGPAVQQGESTVEREIAEAFVTESLVRKELAKILSENDGKPVQPRLLSTVYHAILTEETWNFVKKFNNPTVDFKKLQKIVYARTKQFAPEYF